MYFGDCHVDCHVDHVRKKMHILRKKMHILREKMHILRSAELIFVKREVGSVGSVGRQKLKKKERRDVFD